MHATLPLEDLGNANLDQPGLFDIAERGILQPTRPPLVNSDNAAVQEWQRSGRDLDYLSGLE